MKGLCPFHDEKSPSFHVTPARGFFHCFGCQEGGDVISFLMKIDGLAFTEAVERLADKYGVQLRREDGDVRDDRPQGPAAAPADRGQPAGPGVLRRPARHAPTRSSARQFLDRARLRPGRRRDVRHRLRPARRRGAADSTCGSGASREEELVAAGLVAVGRVGVRPVPRPAAVADPRRQRRHHRLRRPADLRRRQDRGEVPQHPRDAASTRRARCSTASTWPAATWPGRRRRSSSRATPT